MSLDDWQARTLDSREPRILLLCSRQAGKSTIAACKGLFRALYYPNSLVLIVSPALRQSSELFKKVIGTYEALGKPQPVKNETQLQVTFANGSRIVSLPGRTGDTIRGYSAVDLLIVDEAARVQDDVYASIRPMLAVSGGQLIALSTPFGERGWFFESWRNEPDWLKIKVSADQCPRISAEFLARERATMSPRYYRSEYHCEFAAIGSQLFDHETLMRCVNSEIEPRLKGFKERFFAERGLSYAG